MQHPGSAWTASAVIEVLASRRRGADPVAPRTPDVEWSDVMQAVLLHRVHGLLAPHVAELGVPERFADRLGAAQRSMLDNGIAVTCDTGAVSDLLDTAGIEHLIVKGVALAAVVGDLPALRGGGDIDVWVRPGEAAEVELLARADGWHRRPIASRLPQPADTWRWRTLLRFAHEQPLDHAERATLDLHWRLAEHQDELGFDFDDALRRSIAVPVIGQSARTLCLEDAFVHMAQHGRKEVWSTLRHLLDVVRLVEACGRNTTRELVRTHRNVALAVLTASRIDPSLHELADAADHHTRALADEAWRGCLSLEFPRQIRRAMTGRNALRSRLRYESWLARSAPTWATRWVWALHLAVPLRRLIEPAPSRVQAEPVDRSSR